MKGKLVSRNGLWYCVFYFQNRDGEFKQKWLSTGLKIRGNKKPAQDFLASKLKEFSYLEPEDLISPHDTDEEKAKKQILWLDWLKKYVENIKPKLSESQYYVYKHTYLNTFYEYWGKKEPLLTQITTEDIQKFYDYLKNVRKIKNITIKHYAGVIRPALRKAFVDKLIKENPYDRIEPIHIEHVEHSFYDKDEIELLFKAIKGHQLELPIKMLVYYGLRRSELIGIRWDAIDFQNKVIHINHKVLEVEGKIICKDKMKTVLSNRSLPLFSKIETELIKHKEQIEKNKNYFGNNYNHKYDDFVFVDSIGNLLLPDTLSHSFKRIIRQNNLKDIRLHDLRHSCASLLLANGVQMKQIQEWLGHSNFSTTADIYSHLDYSSKIQSAKVIANVLDDKKIEEPEKDKFAELEETCKKLGFASITDLITLAIKNIDKLKND